MLVDLDLMQLHVLHNIVMTFSQIKQIVMLLMHTFVILILKLQEKFVDFNLELLDVLQNPVMTFSKIKQMMQLAKPIYQVVIYQHPTHVQRQKQEHVNPMMQLQELMPLMQPFAILI